MAPTLHFFCGKAGAGKSTLAARIAQETGAVLISEDVWMTRLFGDELKTFDDYIRFSRRLNTVVGPLTVDLLRAGHTVVLDFQANTRNRRQWLRSLFEPAGAAHVLHLLPTSDAECLARIAKRNVERPEGSHELTEADFHHVSSFFQAPGEDEGFHVVVHAG
jgi:predicted kinase